MKVSTLTQTLNLRQLTAFGTHDEEFMHGFACDLLSEVIGSAPDKSVWITVQTHKNVIAIASLRELSAVILASGHLPDQETIEAANKENVLLLSSTLDTFTLAGNIFSLLATI